MELFQNILQLIFDMIYQANLPVIQSLLIFYLVMCSILIFIKIVKGVRR